MALPRMDLCEAKKLDKTGHCVMLEKPTNWGRYVWHSVSNGGSRNEVDEEGRLWFE